MNRLTVPLPWWDLRGRGPSLIRFGLARRWLRALPPVYLHTSPRIVTVRRIIPSHVSRASEWPLSCYLVIIVSECFIVPLTWYSVSHDGFSRCTNLSPSLLMFLGVPRCSIPISYCTWIAVLTLVDDYCINRPMWPLAKCISSVVVVHQAPQLGVLQSPFDSVLLAPHLLRKSSADLGESLRLSSHPYFESKSD